VAEYRGTVHGKARADGRTLAASCTDCHGTHDIRRAKDPASPTNHVNLEATCSKCHGSDAYVEKAKLPGGNVGKQYHDSVHGKLLAGKGPERQMGPECTDCHGTHDIRAKDDPQSRVHRARVPETCGSCHDAIRAVHRSARQVAAAGMTRAPTATTATPRTTSSGTTCPVPAGGDQAVRQLPPGLHRHLSRHVPRQGDQPGATRGRDLRTATVRTRCCGVRPASKVSAGNRLKDLPGLPRRRQRGLRQRDPHANKHDRAQPRCTGRPGSWRCCFGVFGFFGIHTVFWFYRSLRVRLAAGRAHGGS
jgi:hypothetical protein